MVPTARSLHPQEGDPPPSPPCQPRGDAEDPGSACDSVRAQLFMSANDPMAVLDGAGYCLDANQAACLHLGYMRDELLGITAWQIRGVTEETWRDFFAQTMQLGSWIVETEHRRRDGTVVPVEISLRSITYQGRPAVLSAVRNIELRQTLQAELLRRNRELATLLANASGNGQIQALPSQSPQDTSSKIAVDTVLPGLIEQARQRLAFDSAAIAIRSQQTDQFVVRLAAEDGCQRSPGTLWSCPPDYVASLNHAHPVLLPPGTALANLGQPARPNGHHAEMRGMIVPALAHGRLLGVLSLGRHDGPGFTGADAGALTGVINQLAVAIDSACELEHTWALAVTEERNRLGRELHDRVGQALASALAYADVAGELLDANQTAEATWAVSRITDSLHQAYAELREAIYVLRNPEVGPEEWVDSLRQFVSRYEQQWGIHCELVVGDGAAAACGAYGRLGLMHILQEALTNVRKHAQARQALVTIVLEDDAVLARVIDEGRGFNPSAPGRGHYGLETMRERAQALGGELKIASGPTGTTLCVTVPVRYTP